MYAVQFSVRMFLIPLLTINLFSLCCSTERDRLAYEQEELAHAQARKVTEVYDEQQHAKYFFAVFLDTCIQLKTSSQHNNKGVVELSIRRSLPEYSPNHLDRCFFGRMAKIYQQTFPYNYNHCTELDIKPVLTYVASYGLVDEVHLALEMNSDLDMLAEDCQGQMPLDKITDLISERLRFLESITCSQGVRKYPEAPKLLLSMQTRCKSLIRDLNYRKVVKKVQHYCKLSNPLLSLVTEYIDKNDTYAGQEKSSCAIL